MQLRQLTNPHAPPALAGLADASPENAIDAEFSYVLNTDIPLTAGELRPIAIPIDPDAEYEWRGMLLTKATGAFEYRISDSSGYYFSSGFVHSANISTNPANPTPCFPESPFPPSGRVNFDLHDLAGGVSNDIQIVLRGVKRYKVPQ